jgi:hypothetical protein
MQRFQTRLPAEAVELLAVDTHDVSEIAVPAKNSADNFVEFWGTKDPGSREAELSWGSLDGELLVESNVRTELWWPSRMAPFVDPGF